MNISASLSLVGILLVLTLAGCNPSATSGAPSQVVASVGDQEISLLQFNQALKTVGVPKPNEPIRREVTEKLIDRELAVAQALAAKLDRTPEVLLEIEEVRRDILARAYAERVAATAEPPKDAEVARYFAEHPELFGERRIYRLREVVLPAEMPQMADAKARLAQRQPLAQLVTWLREQNAGFNDQMVIRAAEQLPIEALPRLSTATENQTVIFETPRGVIAYMVLATQSAPVSWEDARPIIRDYLTKQAGKRTMEAKVKELRAATKVAYGEAFRPPAAAAVPGPVAAALLRP